MDGQQPVVLAPPNLAGGSAALPLVADLAPDALHDVAVVRVSRWCSSSVK